MKTFIIACVVAVIVAAVGGIALETVQKQSDKAFATTGVRLGS